MKVLQDTYRQIIIIGEIVVVHARTETDHENQRKEQEQRLRSHNAPHDIMTGAATLSEQTMRIKH